MTTSPGKPNAQVKKAADAIRRFCLAYPHAHEDMPWGHSAFKVKGKTFVFMGAGDAGLSVSVKLNVSHVEALDLPFCSPTHYGLGKHGWVSAGFDPKDAVPLPLLEAWIDESFRAVAPKTVLKALAADEAPAAPKAKTTAKKTAKTTAKKTARAGKAR